MILGLLQTLNGERHIRKCLTSLSAVCDGILVLDDGSTDGTPEILSDRAAWPKIQHVTTMPNQHSRWGTTDKALRSIMLRMADRYQPTWCVSLDDDEEFEDPDEVRKAIQKCKTGGMVTALVHMWDRPDQARVYYVGKRTKISRLRIWRWRPHEEMPEKDLHGGSAPARDIGDRDMREDLRIIHWGYYEAKDRQKKYEMYTRLDPAGKFNSGTYIFLVKPVGLEPIQFKRPVHP